MSPIPCHVGSRDCLSSRPALLVKDRALAAASAVQRASASSIAQRGGGAALVALAHGVTTARAGAMRLRGASGARMSSALRVAYRSCTAPARSTARGAAAVQMDNADISILNPEKLMRPHWGLAIAGVRVLHGAALGSGEVLSQRSFVVR